MHTVFKPILVACLPSVCVACLESGSYPVTRNREAQATQLLDRTASTAALRASIRMLETCEIEGYLGASFAVEVAIANFEVQDTLMIGPQPGSFPTFENADLGDNWTATVGRFVRDETSAPTRAPCGDIDDVEGLLLFHPVQSVERDLSHLTLEEIDSRIAAHGPFDLEGIFLGGDPPTGE